MHVIVADAAPGGVTVQADKSGGVEYKPGGASTRHHPCLPLSPHVYLQIQARCAPARQACCQ